MFSALFILGLGDGGWAAASAERPVALTLKGDRERDYHQRPVYRRFNRMSIELDGVLADDLDEILLVLEPLDQHGRLREPPMLLNHRADLYPVDLFGRARAEWWIEADEGPMPVGPYRLVVYRQGPRRIRPVAQQLFLVIFNAFDQIDQEAYHWRAGSYLGERLHIMHRSDGKPRLYEWELDIFEAPVLDLAILTVAGSESPESAVRRVAQATAERLQGYWPDLTDVNQQIPYGTPANDPEWSPTAVRSMSDLLRSGDPRAQCFTYTALSVALLRSVGIPATAATVMDPEHIEHPYDWNRQIAWNFHVWTEVYLEGDWTAIDITYLDPELAPPGTQRLPCHLQRTNGPWFARMIGGEARVWRQTGQRVIEITDRYRNLVSSRFGEFSRRRTPQTPTSAF